MSPTPYIPETAPFTAEQRAWLNGFLAGLLARNPPGPEPTQAPEPARAPGTPLLILFGSQTGTAEGVAQRIGEEAASRGFAPTLAPLDDFERVSLATGRHLIVVSSTWGDGDPPDNAAAFWAWLSSEEAPRLEHLHYAVLGLGDRNYEEFCGASKKFDARLEALGGQRLLPRAECDVDYEETAATWIDQLWETLGSAASNGNGHAAPPIAASNGKPAGAPPPAVATAAFGRANPFPGTLLRNLPLNKPGSAKEVRHYEISLDTRGLSYEVGDALAVLPCNSPNLVAAILASCQATGEEEAPWDNSSLPVRDILATRADISKPSHTLVEKVALLASGSELAAVRATGDGGLLKKWLWGRDVLDLLQLLPKGVTVADLLPLLSKLTPRLYSIASSPRVHPGEVHLTVGTVRYQSHGRSRLGVASTFLAERTPEGGKVPVYVQPSAGFKLPADPQRPVIMVGPGTGIAPFRAFLEERQAAGAPGGNWLFFGDQKRATDFLHEDQLTTWLQEGHLKRLDLAFSRDQVDKVYVQHRMLEAAGELWRWLEEGAHFYVCGDASRMAKDVDAALHRVIETAGGKSPEDAQAYVAQLRSEKRYQRDVY